ncbi:MAG: polysaccharide biosynthesis/export family protein [Candidatus Omnitrophota bacterium]
MLKKIIFFLFLISITSSFFGFSQDKIGPGDVLKITVPGQSFLDTKTSVSSQGGIEYALLGDIKIAGLTVDEAEKKIGDLLEIYYPIEQGVRIKLIKSKEIKEVSNQFQRRTIETESRYYSDTSEEERYQINPFDTIEIIVYNQPDLSLTTTISEEGTIQYPLLGVIELAGLSLSEAAVKIENLLEPEYLTNPRVTVTVIDYSDFSVLGAVNKPGKYELEGPYTLLDAIVVAEGPKEEGNLRRVEVFRALGVKGKKQYVIDAEKRGDSFFIKPKDKVIVPEYKDIYILGAVKNPGAHKLERGDLDPLEAIKFLAGGAEPTADLGEVRILREEAGEEKNYILNLEKENQYKDFFLKEGDRIYLEEYQQLFITGEVNKAGEYPYRKGLTVLDAISLAGDFTEVASKNGVKVIRKKGDQEKIIKVPVGYIMKTGDRSQDVELKEGDTIVVPESWF